MAWGGGAVGGVCGAHHSRHAHRKRQDLGLRALSRAELLHNSTSPPRRWRPWAARRTRAVHGNRTRQRRVSTRPGAARGGRRTGGARGRGPFDPVSGSGAARRPGRPDPVRRPGSPARSRSPRPAGADAPRRSRRSAAVTGAAGELAAGCLSCLHGVCAVDPVPSVWTARHRPRARAPGRCRPLPFWCARAPLPVLPRRGARTAVCAPRHRPPLSGPYKGSAP